MGVLEKIHISLTIVLALSLFIVIQCCRFNEKKYQEEHAINKDDVDTVVYYKTDTIVETRIKYKDKLVKDTIYLSQGDDPFLLLVQKHFHSYDRYDVWVSGVEPLSLDSVMVYPKTEMRYVTQTKTIYDTKGTDIYGVVGFSRFNGTFSSNVGIYASTNRKWLYGAEIGLIDAKWYVGAKVGFKINNK